MGKEIQLTGGRSTNGVVRSDNVVFRPHKKESDFANKFLEYLENQNFAYSQNIWEEMKKVEINFYI